MVNIAALFWRGLIITHHGVLGGFVASDVVKCCWKIGWFSQQFSQQSY